MPRARGAWALDSGGFTELSLHGRWVTSAAEYADAVTRYSGQLGRLDFAAPQDWMCEPAIINGGVFNGQRFAGTHLSVPEHQRRTVANYIELRELAPDLPIIPVVQGDTPDAYRRCVDLYWSAAYIDLTTLPRVGIGSICRRQGTAEAGRIIRVLRRAGLHRLHLFGFSTLGLAAHADLLTDVDTCDSMAWSDAARKLRRPALPQCELRRRHINCANCLPYALRWRAQLLAAATPLTTPSTGVAA
jgi:hypothetical protein